MTTIGAGTPTAIASPPAPTLSNPVIQSVTDILFSITPTAAIPVGSGTNGFAIYLPSGYSIDLTTLVVQINAVTIDPNYIHYLPIFSCITVFTSTALAASTAHSINVKFVKTPVYQQTGVTATINTLVYPTIINSATYSFPLLSPGTLAYSQISANDITAGLLWANYTFSFTPSLPSSNRISLIFDPVYFADGIEAECDNLIWSGLVDKDSSHPVVCTRSANVIFVDNFQPLSTTLIYNVSVFGVTNPAGATYTGF